MQLPIFVISLADAIDRRTQIAAQMLHYGLAFEFVNAVNGRSLNAEQEALVDKNWQARRSGEPMRPSEIGCAMSHALLWKRILKEGHPSAIILEDDAIINQDFVEFALNEISLPKECQLLVFHCYPNQFGERNSFIPLNNKYNIYRPFRRFFGTCGYYLTREAAYRLYTAALPIWTQADWPLAIQDVLNARGIEPAIVFQDEEFPTTIQMFNRRIPFSIRLGRLLFIPTLIFPKKFGSYWKAKYAWEAIFFKASAFLFARRPRAKNASSSLSHNVPFTYDGRKATMSIDKGRKT